MEKIVVMGGHSFDVLPFNIIDKKQVYRDFMPVFDSIVALITEYKNEYPFKRDEKEVFLTYSKKCIYQIKRLKKRFIDGITYLSDEQMPLFRFFVARELFEIVYIFDDRLGDHLINKKNYFDFSCHFLPRFNDLVYTAIPQDAYGELNGKYQWRVI